MVKRFKIFLLLWLFYFMVILIECYAEKTENSLQIHWALLSYWQRPFQNHFFSTFAESFWMAIHLSVLPTKRQGWLNRQRRGWLPCNILQHTPVCRILLRERPLHLLRINKKAAHKIPFVDNSTHTVFTTVSSTRVT